MEKTTSCVACGQALASYGSRPRKWCSDRCRYWARKNPGVPYPSKRSCGSCGVDIRRMNRKAIFCSDRCLQRARAAAKRAAIGNRICLQCHRAFRPFRASSTCCSVRCYRTYWQKAKYATDPATALAAAAAWRRGRTREQLLREQMRDRLAAKLRRARLRSALCVPFTDAQLMQRMSMFAGCWMCGGEAEQVDHVKPLSAGGAHILANLRPACGYCNRSKGPRWPVEVSCLGVARAKKGNFRH
jgi:5-methylcytosine-specific restriction endonuclease McrA